MKISDNLSMAFRDLNRRKKRTFLTSLGITVGAILIILMVSLGMMIKGFLVDTVNSGGSTKNVTVQALKADAVMPTNPKEMAKDMPLWIKNNFKALNENSLAEIAKVKDVQGIQAYINASLAEIKIDNKVYYGNFPIKGYDANYDTYFDSDVKNAKSSSKDVNFKAIIAGKNISKNVDNGIVVGQSLLKDIGVSNPSDIVGKNLSFVINNIEGKPVTPMTKEFKVVGVESKYMPDGNKFVMSAKNAGDIAGFLQYNPQFMKDYGYNGVVVEANNMNNVASVQAAVQKIGYQATSDKQKVDSINENFGNIILVLSILGIIVLIVAAIGIINTMIMAVTERTKSIGVMKSVGASNSDVKSMFLVQSGAIGLVGGVIGSIISVVLFKVISIGIAHMLTKQGQGVSLLSNVPWWLILATIIFSIVVSVLAGVYPASRAAKLDPVESLRQ
ncbi:FtsX-like permease family protein [uncultured Clostridium sp.]|jgi:putative ABC transport system permease protein|uniref:ABC transporter permease n=1 Tax=uncultured Clostridium sp. TaxID=59620 RepID=UPI00262CC7F1|nr:FtsX-like permease family protein [uncultured Clostridium sp.]